ncbi:hypothetical protein GCM10012278_08720 [Nonomuraea glycinis]|uniref:Tyr recombinase domain-containing protein n=1 Tax=Nonomuraea glycinis TaxID=2047744 RepID=A0A918E3W3_9ACTN|nr:hypothetical protein GCM10012278_08720 [Nonomuraea glycinis]
MDDIIGRRRGGRRVDPIDAYIRVPRPSAVMVWTPEQTRLFLEEASRHRLFALYRLITLRGLWRGEACGLRWKDVDLDAGTVSIAWQLVQLAGRIHEGRPKTNASMRTVALDAETIAILRAHQRRQHQERLATGEAWRGDRLRVHPIRRRPAASPARVRSVPLACLSGGPATDPAA